LAKPEWGTKRTCQACGSKFYDLLRSPIACPSCGVVYEPEAALKVRRPRADAKAVLPKPRELVVDEPELVTADADFALDDIEADAGALAGEAEEETADEALPDEPALEVAEEGDGEALAGAVEEELTEIDESEIDGELDADKDPDDSRQR